MALDKNLIILRKKHNLSQEQLADQLGVSRQAVSKWESGQTMPDVEKLMQLSELFHVPVDQLLKNLEQVQQPQKDDQRLYTILSFAALAIVWFTGMILVIVNVFFNSDVFQVSIYLYSCAMMASSGLIFIAMLIWHQIKKHRK